jgi:hypothetical protein
VWATICPWILPLPNPSRKSASRFISIGGITSKPILTARLAQTPSRPFNPLDDILPPLGNRSSTGMKVYAISAPLSRYWFTRGSRIGIGWIESSGVGRPVLRPVPVPPQKALEARVRESSTGLPDSIQYIRTGSCSSPVLSNNSALVGDIRSALPTILFPNTALPPISLPERTSPLSQYMEVPASPASLRNSLLGLDFQTEILIHLLENTSDFPAP